MIITRSQFREQFKNKTLKIAFIGMSNIGKSYCSEKLKEVFDFEIYGVDASIQEALGQTDWAQASNWMGYPNEKKYPENEKKYLALEEEKTLESKENPHKNNILDTTGSAIYLSEDVHEYLRNNFLIIGFDVANSMIAEMEKEFFISPKTVVWGNSFKQKEGESAVDALRRCYPELLNYRIQKYRELADVIIPGEFSRYKGLKAERILEVIELSLPKE